LAEPRARVRRSTWSEDESTVSVPGMSPGGAILCQVFSALVMASLVLNAGCGATIVSESDATSEHSVPESEAAGEIGNPTTSDSPSPSDARSDMWADNDKASEASDASATGDAVSEVVAADSSVDNLGGCVCSKIYGPCGAANPCGCCDKVGTWCALRGDAGSDTGTPQCVPVLP
jgi:hypothetical protein